MRILFLVGPRAAGKTSLGKALAQRLGIPFVDTDASLTSHLGRSVAEIVAAEGWPGFRAHESATLLREIAAHRASGAVMATGGGMVLDADNRAQMRNTGLVLHLDAPARVLAERLAAEPLAGQRPSLTGQDMLAEVEQVLAERQPLYAAAAHHRLDASRSLQELCEAALAWLASLESKPSDLGTDREAPTA